MSTPTSDVVALVRLLLLGSSSLTARVADRISGPSPQRTGQEEADSLYPRVVIDVAGGGTIAFGAAQGVIVHVYAYSRVSYGDACAIFDLVRPVLRSARLQRAGVGAAGMIRETATPQGGFNAQVGSYFMRGSYRAMTTALLPSE